MIVTAPQIAHAREVDVETERCMGTTEGGGEWQADVTQADHGQACRNGIGQDGGWHRITTVSVRPLV